MRLKPGVIPPGVIGVIGVELWGYKVIPQGGWSYREYRVITPGLSELLTWSYWSYGVIRSYPRVGGVIRNTGL